MRHTLIPLSRGMNALKRLLLPLFLGGILLLMATPATATSLYEMPNLHAGDSTWIIDKADIFSRVNEGKLSQTLQKLAKETGNEVRIATIRHLDYGETVESFTDKLFEQWFPTTEEQANQALMTIDVVTNDVALRSGEGIQQRLPENIADSVVADTIGIPLRNGNQYNKAFIEASDRLAAVLSGQDDPGAPTEESTIQVEGTFAKPGEAEETNATAWIIGLLVAATIIPMATYFIYLAMGVQS